MKKTIFAMAVMMFLASCGNSSESVEQTDSLAATIDTTAVAVIDSTTAEIPADSTASVGEGGKPAHEQPLK
jgi:hypothetical protein